jgi:integrase
MILGNAKGVKRVWKSLSNGSRKLYYYHRTTGRRLHGEPGSVAFTADYTAAEQTNTVFHAGKLNGLIHKWTLSPQWNDPTVDSYLANSTQREYRRMLTLVEQDFGTMPIAALNDPLVKMEFMKWRAQAAKTPREGDNRLSILSSLLTWAADNGEIETNHLKSFKRLYHSDRSNKVWLPVHIDLMMRTAPVEMQRLLIAGIHTGQRQGDLLRLTWSNFDGSSIRLRQSKTGRIVEIPCTVPMHRMLNSLAHKSPLIFTTKTGMPWKPRYFKNEWELAYTAAGLPLEKAEKLHFNDLRGTAVILLFEANWTTRQIATITGHGLASANKILKRHLDRTRNLASAASRSAVGANSTPQRK